MAKRNLQEPRIKIKVWFEHRVLVLFPVVVTPCRQNTLDLIKWLRKKVTNYLVKTPGGHKEKQVCHINMLKAYHEKPKLELVTLYNRLGLEDCADLEVKKEEDTESEVGLGNDQQPLQLQNSMILEDLGTKLSHLPSVKVKSYKSVQRSISQCPK